VHMPEGIVVREQERLIWDLPVRVSHWLVVVAVATCWATHYAGVEWFAWHRRSGYTVLVLVVFRVLWGFLGTRHARFASFLRGPRVVADYLRGRAPAGVGHGLEEVLVVVLSEADGGGADPLLGARLAQADELARRGEPHVGLAVGEEDHIAGACRPFGRLQDLHCAAQAEIDPGVATGPLVFLGRAGIARLHHVLEQYKFVFGHGFNLVKRRS